MKESVLGVHLLDAKDTNIRTIVAKPEPAAKIIIVASILLPMANIGENKRDSANVYGALVFYI